MRVKSALTIITFTAVAALAGPALAEGDAAAGEKVFNKCKACHTVEEGKNRVGPSLFNIVGRQPATVEGFRYSKAMEDFADGKRGRPGKEAIAGLRADLAVDNSSVTHD